MIDPGASGRSGGPGESAPPGAASRAPAAPWWEKPVVVACALSLFLHLVLATQLAATLLEPPRDGQIKGDEFELAIMSDEALHEMETASVSRGDPFTERLTEVEASFEVMDPNAVWAVFDPERDLNDRSPMLAGASGVDRLLSASGSAASFFGIEARGTRFAFVVDISGSMSEGTRMADLKRALRTSIENLSSDAHFAVFLYSTGAVALTDSGWVRAGDRQRGEVIRRLEQIDPSGATNPVPAFEMVLRLRPQPDAIYFMTDGMFEEDREAALLGLIIRSLRDGDGRVPVHCITFANRDGERSMRRIALQTGGTYTHVEGGR